MSSKYRHQRGHSRAPAPSSRKFGLVLFVLGFFCGVAVSVAFLGTGNKFVPQVASPSVSKVLQRAKSGGKTSKQQPEPGQAEFVEPPKFDFYTTLSDQPIIGNVASQPNPTADVEDVELAVSSSETHSTHMKQQTLKSKVYLVQVAAVSKAKEADRLKAQLLLVGFDVSVKSYTREDQSLGYRVFLGPYSSKEQALAMQQKLAQSHITSSVLQH